MALALMTAQAVPGIDAFLGGRFSTAVRPSFPFQARYEEVRRPIGHLAAVPEVANGRLYVDSDGRTRVDQETDGLTLILDPIANLASLITTPEGTVMWQAPMASNSPEGQQHNGSDSSGSAEPGAPEPVDVRDLGTKSIGGLPSRGSRFTTPGSDAELWIAEDLGIVVWSREARDGQETTYRIYDLQRIEPVPSTFEVPLDGMTRMPRRTFASLWRWLVGRPRAVGLNTK